MKLYVKTPAPSALRVQIFIDEAAGSLEQVEVADTRSSDFLSINPFGTIPVLETDSGEMIAESLTICRYLDRQWSSGLFGSTQEQRRQVEIWERRGELLLYGPAIEYVHQMHPMFAGHLEQHPEWASVLASRASDVLRHFNQQLESSAFIAGDAFSVADITAFLGVFAFSAFGAVDLSLFPGVSVWAGTIRARPSMDRLGLLTM